MAATISPAAASVERPTPEAFGEPVVRYGEKYNPDSGVRVDRKYTTPAGGPFGGIEFTTVDARIPGADGGDEVTVEVPTSWSDTAVTVFAAKYPRKSDVPLYDESDELVVDDHGNVQYGPERSVRQCALRLANAWMLWGQAGGYFASRDDAVAFRDELAYLIATQAISPNSPQWFNTGIYEAYGIVEDPEGNWYYDPELAQAVQTDHKFQRSAVNACFISPMADDMDAITGLVVDEARLFKAGSGNGVNLSPIRGEGERLSGGGTASGPLSFMRAHDASAGAIKSGGRTRRAAKMVILDDDHPDVEGFVWCKAVEERKIPALVQAGYPLDWNDPDSAYAQVFFQNANLSVRISDEFMKAVADDAPWHLRGRKDDSVKTVRARDLWQQIAQAAYECADPGVQFDTTIQQWHVAPGHGRINASNPCAEFLFLDGTSCNLASVNVGYFHSVDGRGRVRFDTDGYLHTVRLGTVALEISVGMSHYPTAVFAENSYAHRPLGMGLANLGAVLMRSGIPYDSPEGRAVMGTLASLSNSQAWTTSAELAAAVGPCEGWASSETNRDALQRVLGNHRRASYGTLLDEEYEGLSTQPLGIDHDALARTPFAGLGQRATSLADGMVLEAASKGVRNMQATNIAPTGTIGMQMGCDTTGVEPDYATVKLKMLAGGGSLLYMNQSIPPALRALGYTDAQIDRIVEWVMGQRNLDGDAPVNRDALRRAGVADETLDVVEQRMSSTSGLSSAFATLADGGDGWAALRSLGFTDEQLRASEATLFGHGTVEGAPDLDPSHLPVFDTSVASGDGNRSIRWQGHVLALAAVQPHLSGSASKTVNLPAEATVDDIKAVYELAHATGVKCVAVYRDGSKTSQVLSAGSSDERDDEGDDLAASEEVRKLIAAGNGSIPLGTSPTAFYGSANPPKFRLPSVVSTRREKFTIGDTDVFLHIGEYADGTPGELWIEVSKEGTTLKAIANGFAMMTSMALQRGVPLDEIVQKFRGHQFPPSGVVSGHPNLKMASSIFDAIARILGYRYLDWAADGADGYRQYVQVHTDDDPAGHDNRTPQGGAVRPNGEEVEEASTSEAGTTAAADTMEELRAAATTGAVSSCCQAPAIQTGTCLLCTSCLQSSGCS